MTDDGPSPATWAELRATRPNVEGALVTREVLWGGQGTGILMGMDLAGDLNVLVPVSAGPKKAEPPDLTGLRVRHLITGAGGFLGLWAPASHERVFTPFCGEVIKAIHGDGRDPWAVVAGAIREWQSAFRPGRQAMSRAVQVGLAGELLVLQRVLVPILGAQAIFHWSGPDRERHDFVVGPVHLEVKTTRGSRHEHEISRLDQLWAAEGDRLFVASVQLEETQGGLLTLAVLIDAILQAIGADSAAVDDFMLKLVRLGWDDEMRRSGELMMFNPRDFTLHDVDARFPRLPPDFRPPGGVIEIRYTISLANLDLFDGVEFAELVAAGDPG